MMNFPVKTLAALCISSPLLGAETIVVSPPEFGSHTHAIHDAVEAAAAGDVILILPGSYGHNETIIIDKPLTLMGAGSEVTSYSSIGNFPGDEPLPLYIHNLEAGEEVRVIGLELAAVTYGGVTPTVLVVTDCVGPVVLADLVGSGSQLNYGSYGVVRVLRSNQVLLDACELRAGSMSLASGHVGPALAIEDSQVHINACSLFGGFGAQTLFDGTPSFGSSAVTALDSQVRISNSIMEGGPGSDYLAFFDAFSPKPNPESLPGLGAPAIDAFASSIYIRGGSATTLTGGAGGENLVASVPLYSSGGAAVRFDSDSLVSYTPGVALIPGLDGDGADTAPEFEGTGIDVPLAFSLAQLTLTPKVANLGANLSLDLGGEAGGIYFTYFSLSQGPAIGFAAIPGLSVLPLGSLFSLPVKSLGTSGAAVLPLHVPTSPSLPGVSLLFQGIALAPDLTYSFSSPAVVGIVQ